jgi:hypothetical protein
MKKNKKIFLVLLKLELLRAALLPTQVIHCRASFKE